MQMRTAEIGVHQQHFAAGLGQSDAQVLHHRGFAFRGPGLVIRIIFWVLPAA